MLHYCNYLSKNCFINRSPESRSQSVTSSKLLFNFTAGQLIKEYYDTVDIISVADKLLIGRSGFSQLFTFSREGQCLTNITTNDEINDASWTPRGNIVFCTWTNRVVVASESGKVILTHVHIGSPRRFSISNDDIIYLADKRLSGVYQSTDDGVSWSIVFKSTDGWGCLQVIKVATNNGNDFWTVEEQGEFNNVYQLRVYSVDGQFPNSTVTWIDVNVPATSSKRMNLFFSSLSYDGNMNIFLSDSNKAVHVFSSNGSYHIQLLSSHHIKYRPCSLSIDRQRQLLYVGQALGTVEVFKLTYGDLLD